MTKKTLGIILMLLGALAFYDCLHIVKIGTIPIRLFFYPVTAILIGWHWLHGDVPFRKSFHHSHILAVISAMIIAALLWKATR